MEHKVEQLFATNLSLNETVHELVIKIPKPVFSGHFFISPVLISGPSVIDLTKQPQPWVDLSCSFSYIKQEYKELDIKWYFSGEEEPILQWVPSASKKPQTIGQTSNELSVDKTTRLSRKFELKDLPLIFLVTTLARLPLSLPS